MDKTQTDDKKLGQQHGRGRRHTMADVLGCNGRDPPAPIIPAKPASCAEIEVVSHHTMTELCVCL